MRMCAILLFKQLNLFHDHQTGIHLVVVHFHLVVIMKVE